MSKLAVKPTLLGPVMTVFVIVTVSVAMGHHDPLLGGPLLNWLIAVVLFGGLALLQGAFMIAVDAVLLLSGRHPPAGARAWAAGLAAPLPVALVWLIARPGSHHGLLFAVAVFGPILVSGWVVRLVACRGQSS
jgi:hypothetical protein